MIGCQHAGRIPPESPVHLRGDRRPRSNRQTLYCIDDLHEQPVRHCVSLARVHQLAVHVLSCVLAESLARKGLQIRFGMPYMLNPVRPRMVRTAADWPWSSYRAMIGEEPAPEWLEPRTILAAFGATEPEAVAQYPRFVAEAKGQPAPWEQLKNQVFLGSDSFVESLRRQLPNDRDLREVPQSKRRPPAKPLPEYARDCPRRNDAIVAAYRSGGYTLSDIGDFFGIHYSRVSKIFQAADVARREAEG
jgi:hypothetical protein